jgi:hypothetical protein
MMEAVELQGSYGKWGSRAMTIKLPLRFDDADGNLEAVRGKICYCSLSIYAREHGDPHAIVIASGNLNSMGTFFLQGGQSVTLVRKLDANS